MRNGGFPARDAGIREEGSVKAAAGDCRVRGTGSLTARVQAGQLPLSIAVRNSVSEECRSESDGADKTE